MDYARECWQNGLDGKLIEDLISHVFRDFAPYAGAEHQRITISRQHNTCSASKLVIEDTGDFLVNVHHTGAGSSLYSTTGILQIDASPVIPLPLSPPWVKAVAASHPPATPVAAADQTEITAAQRRFFSSRRGAELLHGTQTYAASHAAGSPTYGQVELEGHMPGDQVGRRAVGLSLGPLTARVTSVPTPVRNPSEFSNSSLDHSDRSSPDPSKLGPGRQWVVDAAWCIPVGGKRTVTEGEVALRAPWALTVGLQHPFESGDTLAAVSVQSDRPVASRFARGAVGSLETVDLPLYVPAGGAATTNTFAVPPTAFRFLVVQTLASSSTGSNATFSTLGGHGRREGQTWQSLPTLVGCNVSLLHQLVRLNFASIFHDGEMDLETAAIVDVSPWSPHMPTLLKLGWNNTGRVAVGIQSLFYNALSVTLGVHAMPKEDMKFGIEIAF